MSFRVKRLNKNAKLPEKGSAGAAGYDLFASEPRVIPRRGRELVPTGLEIELPDPGVSTRNGGLRCYGRIAPRSGLALKKGLDVGAGVIDSDFRGEVGIILFNHTDDDFEVKTGDKIAQIVLEVNISPLVEEVFEIQETERGKGGFGSTDEKRDRK